MKMPINTSGVALAAVAAVLFNVVAVGTAAPRRPRFNAKA
jgi:hypothetical protein